MSPSSISRSQCRYPIHFTGSSPHPSVPIRFSAPENKESRHNGRGGGRPKQGGGKQRRSCTKETRKFVFQRSRRVPPADDTRTSANGPAGGCRGRLRETSKQKETGNPPGCLASIFNAAGRFRLFSRATIEVTPAGSRAGDDAPTSTVFALDRGLETPRAEPRIAE